MRTSPLTRVYRLAWLAVVAACAVDAAAMDSYNASTNTLSIPYVLVGNTLYTNVNVTVGSVLGVGASTGAGSNDVYTASNGQLLVNSVQVGSQVFSGVTITLKGVVSVGGT